MGSRHVQVLRSASRPVAKVEGMVNSEWLQASASRVGASGSRSQRSEVRGVATAGESFKRRGDLFDWSLSGLHPEKLAETLGVGST